MEIIYSDDNLVFCIKSAGMISEDSENDVLSVPKALRRITQSEIYTVHRLDKEVGGLMVYAKNKASAAKLSEMIRTGKMEKCYLALLHGEISEGGILTDLLFKDRKTNKTYVVKKERKGVKKAQLEFSVIGKGVLDAKAVTAVKVHLITGRSHQIRVQFASRKHPLVGDRRYGAKDKCGKIQLWSYSVSLNDTQQNYCKAFEIMPQDDMLISQFVK